MWLAGSWMQKQQPESRPGALQEKASEEGLALCKKQESKA